jgi:hypothetical protein
MGRVSKLAVAAASVTAVSGSLLKLRKDPK